MSETAPTSNDYSAVLVAGAAGMVGSHLCEVLVEMGAKVIGLDDLHTGKEENLERLRDCPDFDLLEVNIAEGLPDSVYQKDISHVVHVANAFPYVGRQDLELSELLVNSHGTKNLLDLAQEKKARLVYTSSLDIYRGLASHRDLEHYYDGLEVSAYFSFVEAKRYGEALAKEYWDNYGVDVRIARLASVYGPRMSLGDSSTLTRLIRLALEGKDLIIDEEGSRRHQLIFVSDAVYGLVKLLFSDKEEAVGGIFNFANPEHVSTLSIAYTLRELVGEDLKVEFMPTHQSFRLPDPPEVEIERSKRILFWNPEVDLMEGLERTLKYFVEREARKKQGAVKRGKLKRQKEEEVEESKTSRGTKVLEAKTKSGRKLPRASLQEASPSRKGEGSKKRGWIQLAQETKGKTPDLLRGLYQKKARLRFSRFRRVMVAGMGILFILTLPLDLTFALAAKAYSDLRRGDFVAAKTNFSRAGRSAQFFPERSLADLMLAGYLGASAADNFKKASSQLMPLTSGLLVSWQTAPRDHPRKVESKISPAEVAQRLASAREYLRQAQGDFALMQAQLQRVEQDSLLRSLGVAQRVGAISKRSERISPLVKQIDDLVDFLPSLLGYTHPTQYLILLQNNTELRPTGGFIGSYLVFRLENGEFTRFKVDDIYNPDGLLEQLPEDVRTLAPEEINDYMGVKYLGIRDANWWPDFSQSAQQIIRLYHQATKEEVDAVVGINLDVVRDLLKITGPVYLSEYGEKVTAENLFQRVEVHAEIGFQPGSQQKKNFLAVLAATLTNRLTQLLGTQKGLSVLEGVVENLRQRNILFYSRESALQDFLVRSGWAGRLREFPADYLYVVDANVGGNKANFWVKRETNYRVDVDRDGNLIGNLEIVWKHTSTSTTWPSGDYRNYLRVYLPQGVEVTETSGFAGSEVKTTQLFGKTQVAGLVKVAVNSTQRVRLRYRLPPEFSLARRNFYRLLVQKQPGVEDGRFMFSLNLPVFLSSPTQTAREVALDEDKVIQIQVYGNDKLMKVKD